MIIYYHCTRDSALLLSFSLTCHPYFPFHFDFYTCNTLQGRAYNVSTHVYTVNSIRTFLTPSNTRALSLHSIEKVCLTFLQLIIL